MGTATQANVESPGGLVDGDAGFIGVDNLHSPEIVKPGFVSDSVNGRFTFGIWETRRGYMKVPLQFIAGTISFPWTFPITFKVGISGAGSHSPFSNIQGTGVFDDPNGSRWMIVAANGVVYKTQPFQLATTIPLNGNLISGKVTFLQCFNVLLMFRGETYPVLACADLDKGFNSVTQSNVGNVSLSGGQVYTIPIPNAASGEFIQNRVFLPHSRDLVTVSDTLDYTRYLPLLQVMRINQGSSDSLKRLYKYSEYALAAFKEYSIYLLNNLYGDLSQAQQQELTRAYGLIAPLSVVPFGSDLFFFSHRGVESLSQTSSNKPQGAPLPFSSPIQHIIDRINWNAAEGIVADFNGSCMYFAIPLDNSTVNNGIIVWDGVNEAWAGYDQSDAFSSGIQTFMRFPFQGQERLWAVCNDGFLNLVEEGFTDDVWDDSKSDVVITQIQASMTTRGYVCGTMERKKFYELESNVQTWNPNYSITAESEGANESSLILGPTTKSRTTYYTFGVLDYDPTNVNDDHATPGRQDYSVKINDHMVGEPPNSFFLKTHGIDPDLHQGTQETYSMNHYGRYVTVTYASTQGRLEVNAVKVSAVGMSAGEGVKR